MMALKNKNKSIQNIVFFYDLAITYQTAHVCGVDIGYKYVEWSVFAGDIPCRMRLRVYAKCANKLCAHTFEHIHTRTESWTC